MFYIIMGYPWVVKQLISAGNGLAPFWVDRLWKGSPSPLRYQGKE